jgi:hypothetical protein
LEWIRVDVQTCRVHPDRFGEAASERVDEDLQARGGVVSGGWRRVEMNSEELVEVGVMEVMVMMRMMMVKMMMVKMMMVPRLRRTRGWSRATTSSVVAVRCLSICVPTLHVAG